MLNGIRTTVTPKSSWVRLREREEGMEGGRGRKEKVERKYSKLGG